MARDGWYLADRHYGWWNEDEGDGDGDGVPELQASNVAAALVYEMEPNWGRRAEEKRAEESRG